MMGGVELEYGYAEWSCGVIVSEAESEVWLPAHDFGR